MDTFLNVVQSILGLGAVVMLPILIMILGIFFRMSIGQALKSGLLVGVGFLGLGLVIGLLNDSLKPALDYYRVMGEGGYHITDIGWPAVGAASWTVPFAALAFPLGLGINILMLKLKLTKTMNVDIWNYMHFLIPGALTYYLYNSFMLGLFVTLFMSIVATKLGDLIAKPWQNYFGLEGTTCTTVMFTAWAWPISWAINKVVDCIPGLNKLELNIDKINKKLGAVGDPVIIGLFVGVLLGVLTKQPYTEVLKMGMGIAGVMILMPKMVGVFMDGLSPIGTSAKSYMQKSLAKDGEEVELHVGMDVALGLGDYCAITTTVLTIPLVILAALILPNIQLFPVSLLTAVCYFSVLCTMQSKGNLFRSTLCTLTMCIVTLYTAAYVAPGATKFLQGAKLPFDGLGTDAVLAEWWNVLIYWGSTLFN